MDKIYKRDLLLDENSKLANDPAKQKVDFNRVRFANDWYPPFSEATMEPSYDKNLTISDHRVIIVEEKNNLRL